jgi:hypothetical protein
VVAKAGRLGVLAAALLVGSQSTIAGGPKVPVDVTVCELVKNQRAHDGELVSINARAQTDAIEHTFAADASGERDCAVSISYGPNSSSTAGMEQFTRALTEAHHTSTESRPLLVYARLVGTFHRDKSGAYMPSIEVSDVGSIKIAEGPAMVPSPPPKAR